MRLGEIENGDGDVHALDVFAVVADGTAQDVRRLRAVLADGLDRLRDVLRTAAGIEAVGRFVFVLFLFAFYLLEAGGDLPCVGVDAFVEADRFTQQQAVEERDGREGRRLHVRFVGRLPDHVGNFGLRPLTDGLGAIPE
jgi:hypothetical protein